MSLCYEKIEKTVLGGISFQEYEEMLTEGEIDPKEAVQDIKYLLSVVKELLDEEK